MSEMTGGSNACRRPTRRPHIVTDLSPRVRSSGPRRYHGAESGTGGSPQHPHGIPAGVHHAPGRRTSRGARLSPVCADTCSVAARRTAMVAGVSDRRRAAVARIHAAHRVQRHVLHGVAVLSLRRVRLRKSAAQAGSGLPAGSRDAPRPSLRHLCCAISFTTLPSRGCSLRCSDRTWRRLQRD